jgi:hypothetical protein
MTRAQLIGVLTWLACLAAIPVIVAVACLGGAAEKLERKVLG